MAGSEHLFSLTKLITVEADLLRFPKPTPPCILTPLSLRSACPFHSPSSLPSFASQSHPHTSPPTAGIWAEGGDGVEEVWSSTRSWSLCRCPDRCDCLPHAGGIRTEKGSSAPSAGSPLANISVFGVFSGEGWWQQSHSDQNVPTESHSALEIMRLVTLDWVILVAHCTYCL